MKELIFGSEIRGIYKIESGWGVLLGTGFLTVYPNSDRSIQKHLFAASLKAMNLATISPFLEEGLRFLGITTFSLRTLITHGLTAL